MKQKKVQILESGRSKYLKHLIFPKEFWPLLEKYKKEAKEIKNCMVCGEEVPVPPNYEHYELGFICYNDFGEWEYRFTKFCDKCFQELQNTVMKLVMSKVL